MSYRVRIEVRQSVERISAIPNKPARLGLLLADMALARLQATFGATSLLMELGFVFEPAVLCRLILEQIAWAYHIHELKDKTEIEKLHPERCIAGLKHLIPDAGKLYGELCKRTHIDPKLVPSYLLLYEGVPGVKLTNGDHLNDRMLVLLHLTDFFCIICEYINREYVLENVCLVREHGSWYVNPNRPLAQSLEQYHQT